jgi:hypothetical protein
VLAPLEEYKPAAHGMQRDASTEPVILADVPDGQLLHMVDAVPLWYVPEAHPVHALVPLVTENSPALHEVHSEAPLFAENSPAEQLKHVVAAAVEYVPASQLKQLDEVSPPLCTEYEPVLHGVQLVAPVEL